MLYTRSVCMSAAHPRGHRVGVRFSGGRVLLPFYADLARKPTFTVLRRFERPIFTELPFYTKFCLRVAAWLGVCMARGCTQFGMSADRVRLQPASPELLPIYEKCLRLAALLPFYTKSRSLLPYPHPMRGTLLRYAWAYGSTALLPSARREARAVVRAREVGDERGSSVCRFAAQSWGTSFLGPPELHDNTIIHSHHRMLPETTWPSHTQSASLPYGLAPEQRAPPVAHGSHIFTAGVGRCGAGSGRRSGRTAARRAWPPHRAASPSSARAGIHRVAASSRPQTRRGTRRRGL
jgi:hypothetical protein